MTQSLGISGGVSATASLLVRTVVALVILTALFFVIRRAIVMFTGARSLQLGRRKYWYFGINLLTVLILFLIRGFVEAALGTLGKSLDGLAPLLEARLGWNGSGRFVLHVSVHVDSDPADSGDRSSVLDRRKTIGPLGSTAGRISADEPSQALAAGFFIAEPRLSSDCAGFPVVGVYPNGFAVLSPHPCGC